MSRPVAAIDADLTHADPDEWDQLLDERLEATGPWRPSQVLARR